ncbi:MAG: hypothetical protein LBL48_06805 [Azoarcus sp.]|jgi:hypothetical protein|nr:hypothetical protein [Azoarcus sp.]
MDWMVSETAVPTPAQHAHVARLAESLDRAAHGERGALIAAAARDMGVAPQTVARWLKDGPRPTLRRRRADAGRHAISRAECEIIARALRRGVRANGKVVRTLTDAVDGLRADGVIRAEVVDMDTGEITPLSLSAISRAMRAYGLDMNTLRAPAPHVSMRSPHPNYLWQVDASVCVLFYLPGKNDEARHCLIPHDDAVHYKNRPENLRAVELFRVIRYVMTDHTSGLLRVRYYPHAESGAHTVDFLCWLMAPKDNPQDPFHGKPLHIMVDPGATASGLVKRFCQRLDIDLIVNKVRNPRAKGQVEQGNNLFELKFEGWLACARDRVTDFAALNALAETWQLWFNRTKKHTRHGMTRFEAWKKITREQLVITAPTAELKKFATGRPLTPQVQGNLTVQFEGGRYAVKNVPGIAIGKPLSVCRLPLLGGGVVAVVEGPEGEVLYPLTEIMTDEWGFPADAPLVGEQYRAMPDTDAIGTAKRLDRLDTGAPTQAEAEKILARDPHRDPFAGTFDPYAAAGRLAASNFADLPQPGTVMAGVGPNIAPVKITATRAAMRARDALGERWRPEMYEFLSRRYPNGIAGDVLARLIERWQTGADCAVRRSET